MKKWLICLCLMMVLAVTAACANTEQPAETATEAEVIGTVNGEDVYRYEYDFYFNMYFDEYFNNYYETLKSAQGVDLLDEESSRELLGDLENYAWESATQATLIRQMAAQEYNLALEPNYTEQLLLPAHSLSITTNRLYAQLYPLIKEEAEAAQAISEEDARAIYESEPTTWDCRQAAHIIIIPAADSEEAKAEAKAQAEGIIAQLDAGADFAEMAQQYSQDGAAADGGAMELYFNRYGGGVSEEASFDADFATATFEMAEIGDYSSTPVESSFGYHIIKMTDKKEGFEAVKDFLMKSNESLSDEAVSEFFHQKLTAAQDAAAVDRKLEFKYYTEPEETAGEDAAGEDTAGEDAAGEDTAGEDAAGEDTAGEDAAGEDTAGEDNGTVMAQ